MGFLSSLKRLFFTTEAVAKSAAEKATNATKDAGKDMFEKGLLRELVKKCWTVMR